MEFLRDAAWQGIGVIIAIISLLLFIIVEKDKLFIKNNNYKAEKSKSLSLFLLNPLFIFLILFLWAILKSIDTNHTKFMPLEVISISFFLILTIIGIIVVIIDNLPDSHHK